MASEQRFDDPALRVTYDHYRAMLVARDAEPAAVEADPARPHSRRMAPRNLAYFYTNRASNGSAEATNLLVEKIRRVAHGYRRFDHADCGSCSTAESNGLP